MPRVNLANFNGALLWEIVYVLFAFFVAKN